MVIAIDGFSSCGKSTFAKRIAEKLHYTYIDSGAMYRAVTLYALKNNLIDENEIRTSSLLKALPQIEVSFKNVGDTSQTLLNGQVVEEEIRTVEVSNYVSPVSAIGEVRTKMVELQRSFGKNNNIVMDGRDIGTRVFPEADLKIFMTASPAIRAERRYKELKEKGEKVNFKEIEENIRYRDQYDQSRKISPLRKAKDAVVLDNSHMTVDEQMVWVMKLIKEKLKDES